MPSLTPKPMPLSSPTMHAVRQGQRFSGDVVW